MNRQLRKKKLVSVSPTDTRATSAAVYPFFIESAPLPRPHGTRDVTDSEMVEIIGTVPSVCGT
jgi:hypothetical protein